MASYVYNSSNELTSTPGATFTYDNNGNTLTKSNSSGTTTYNWDFENRLTSVVLPGMGGTVSFAYDPLGRRAQKTSTNGTTNYLYDGDNSVAEASQTGIILAHYAQDLGIDAPLTDLRNSTVGFYQQDGLGSVTSIADSAATLLNSYTYNSFGSLKTSTGSFVNSYLYTSRYADSETGLAYNRTRYYDILSGHFLSEDPSKLEASLSLYGYVNNSPTNLIDPSGLAGKRYSPAEVISGNKSLVEPFLDGFNEALNIIKANKDCQKFFGCKGVETLMNTHYRILSMGGKIGGQTNGIDDVFINSQGVEFSGSDSVTFGQNRVTGSFQFSSALAVQAFVIMHELGHQLKDITGFVDDGIPGDPKASEKNLKNSLLLIKHCFGDARRK